MNCGNVTGDWRLEEIAQAGRWSSESERGIAVIAAATGKIRQ